MMIPVPVEVIKEEGLERAENLGIKPEGNLVTAYVNPAHITLIYPVKIQGGKEAVIIHLSDGMEILGLMTVSEMRREMDKRMSGVLNFSKSNY